MEKSQLINIIKTFSRRDVREMLRWLQSPVHNLREDVIVLFQYITSDNVLYNNESLAKEAAYKALMPKEKYNDAKMRQVMFFLQENIEQFLAFQEWSKNEKNQRLALAQNYRHRKLEKPFLKTIQDLEKEQSISIEHDASHHELQHRLLEQHSFFQVMNDRSKIVFLQEVNNTLDTYYIAQKLKYFCNMHSHQSVFKIEYDYTFLVPLLTQIQQQNLLSVPAISVYYYIYHTLIEKENPEHFMALKQEISEKLTKFPMSEAREILLMGINYCIGRANAGHVTYFHDAIELFQLGDHSNLLLEDGQVSRFTFRNAVSFGTRIKAFEWVEYFIDKYKKCLDDKYQGGFVQFNYARLYFEKGDYKQAMKLLAQTEYDDILIALNAKFMLLKMYYELREYDVLESHLESMRAYVQRKEVIGYHRNIYKNIIRFAKKLLNLNPTTQKIEALRQDIATTNPMADREWFYRMLDGL
jgi:hypothetical protein